ncbi:MAG: hypothetical protein PHC43_00380 [Candidatus Marinimicrobia bacterium]|jgi:uncharacterized protein YhaN|nr:hypothetical protein [Candidatus Neomarinimicrobiota bacterium]
MEKEREKEIISHLIRIIENVPETQLKIFALLNKFPIKNGELDPRELEKHSDEIEEATREAKAYISATHNMINSIERNW